MAAPDTTSRRLTPTFNFRVTLRKSAAAPSGASGKEGAPQASTSGDLLGDGGFQECNGLEISMDVTELVEGGRNDGVIQRVGRGKYQNIVLKRGLFYDEGGKANPEVWRWLQGILTGVRPVPRYDGVIEVLDPAGDGEDAVVLATWTFFRGLPAKVVGPQLNAKSGDIAIEEIHIAHEGLRLEVQP